MNQMKPTLASQSMVGMTTSILPREGKTNKYRSGTSKSKQGHQYIIQIHPSPYIYDRQIMTLNARICHKDGIKSNDSHNTI